MKILNFFKNDGELLDEISKLQNEKEKICKAKEQVENKTSELTQELEDLQQKYISLLEEKSEKFDLYLQYQIQCKELADDKRELKKQNALLNEQLRETQQTVDSVLNDNEKLQKRLKKMEAKNEKEEPKG